MKYEAAKTTASAWLRVFSFVLFGAAALLTILVIVGAAEYMSLGYGGGGLFVLRLLDALDEMDDLIPLAIGLWLFGGVARGVRTYLRSKAAPAGNEPEQQPRVSIDHAN